MARTVRGTISDANSGNPVAGAFVVLYDSDPGADDLMGSTYTDSNGQYAIQYAGGHWDPAPHRYTIWRPDIYIKVYVWTQGGWVRVGESRTYDNQRLRDDRTINLSVNVPNPHARTCWGRITYEDDGSPAGGVHVSAYDSDVNNPFTETPDGLFPAARPSGLLPRLRAPEDDDFMGSATTDGDGNYVIPYAGRHWDLALHGWTYWRPDIYIMVNGRAPSSIWWQTLGISSVHDNVRHRDGVQINLAVQRPAVVEQAAASIAAIERGLEEMVIIGEKTPDEARAERAKEIWKLRTRGSGKSPREE
jgi:hypothetical protein